MIDFWHRIRVKEDFECHFTRIRTCHFLRICTCHFPRICACRFPRTCTCHFHHHDDSLQYRTHTHLPNNLPPRPRLRFHHASAYHGILPVDNFHFPSSPRLLGGLCVHSPFHYPSARRLPGGLCVHSPFRYPTHGLRLHAFQTFHDYDVYVCGDVYGVCTLEMEGSMPRT